ncbi:hypothetical protein ACQVP2_04710 [Methylobacterium aquaticum]
MNQGHKPHEVVVLDQLASADRAMDRRLARLRAWASRRGMASERPKQC